MKLLSVNVGLPQRVRFQDQLVETSIWKTPVDGLVRVSELNLEGDRQSDLTVHGGTEKAVYVYPSEHYAYWRSRLSDRDLSWGAFGENFTTEGLLEDQVQIGDHLQIGSAEFIVTQPRLPCFKLGIRFNSMDMVRRFLKSKRTGFYLAVIHKGNVAAGNPIYREVQQADALTITDIVKLYTSDTDNRELLRRAMELPALPSSWKEHFRRRLGNLE